MERDAKNSNVDDLMNVIKKDYKAKAGNQWIIILLAVLIGLTLFAGAMSAPTFTDFIRDEGSMVLIVIVLFISAFKNRYYYGKIGVSETPSDLLAAYDKHRKTDNYLLAAMVLMFSLYFYFKKGLTLSFFLTSGVILAMAILLFLFIKDNNVERLRGLVAEQEGKK